MEDTSVVGPRISNALGHVRGKCMDTLQDVQAGDEERLLLQLPPRVVLADLEAPKDYVG